ncbi:AbrB family transcriptional regulator [Zavarzinia compransoris]|uniref:AbrB family transcriptional regulator n=1 Tax=Zavarzinia compransoris TaxID=1264899 RepID=A0A317E582_9PROT|nr:AbrB family transcriptional regulator [Zavarzinia compransoris]PWR20553.1 AbrB family transcriptional regulator [Zavarzinia compransoris]TDP43801.1 AbrB family transcriptional regulator [Zavarzinia compransoris]
MADKPTTIVSSQGQVVLPKAIRQQPPAAPHFPATAPAEVFAALAVKGPPKTLDEMAAAVPAEAKRRHDRP